MLSLNEKIMIKKLSSIKKASLCLAVALIVCLLKMPYGFYTIIRLATAIVMGCWAVRFSSQSRWSLTVISGSIVLLFQPILPIALDRFTWNVVDILLAIFLLVIVFKLDTAHDDIDQSR